MTEKRINQLKYLIQSSCYRLIFMHGEFALPIRKKYFIATKNVRRISTNGDYIYFDPDWLQKLGKKELDFIIMHQLMHMKLGHIDRALYFHGEKFHLACDIVANSNLGKLGWCYESLKGIGKIYFKTFFPFYEGYKLSAEEAMNFIPFDPATIQKNASKYVIDSEEYWGKKHFSSPFDVVILKPDEEYAFQFVAEDTRGGEHIIKKEDKEDGGAARYSLGSNNDNKNKTDDVVHNHLSLTQRKINDVRKITYNHETTNSNGDYEDRLWQEIKKKRLNWKKILNVFIQSEVFDYSFTPPDRRLQDSDFFLPDFNVLDVSPQEVLFLVDTSGSIDNETLSVVYAELCSVLEQFNGKINGILGFFDTRVYRPTPFSNISQLRSIRPIGGGGTDYNCIFNFVNDNMRFSLPSSIVIFTDGDSEFPPEPLTNNIPVLWLFSKETVKAPWGSSAYIKI